jgi:glycosyltransferase involved in cell wall biosynthesis
MTGKAVYILSPGGTAAKGGMGRIVSILAARLDQDRDIPHVVIDTYGPGVNLPGSRKWMPAYFLLAVLRLAGACLAGRVGVAHIHMASDGSVLRKGILLLVCGAFRVPSILHIHGGNLDQFCARGGLGLAFLRRACAQAARVVTLGAYWRDLAVGPLRIDPSKVEILPNAIPAPPAPPPRPLIAPCEIVFLGYVTQEKGLDDLLKALASDALRQRPWRLTLVGSGEIARYSEMAAELGIGERTHFVGWVDGKDVPPYLRRAQILVLPSLFECLPMSIIEAMAHGLPVVATAVGSVPDAVADGETGLLVPAHAPDALASAIRRLIDDPAERQRLGRNGRRRFEERFDLERLHSRLRAMYLERLAAPRPSLSAS